MPIHTCILIQALFYFSTVNGVTRANFDNFQYSNYSYENRRNLHNRYKTKMNHEEILNGICQIYSGLTCENYLYNKSVFIPPNITQTKIEERLKSAYGVIKTSQDINQNCRLYALSSLCYSTLPICRTPERTNLLYFANKATYGEQKLNKKLTKFDRRTRNTQKSLKDRRVLPKKFFTHHDDLFSTEIFSQYPPTRDSENIRRICRDDCVLLENELCQKEYAIAKRHPVIGQKLPLEECARLPTDEDCSTVGIVIDVIPTQKCYWEDGSGYRGTLSLTATGKPCLHWAMLMREISDYPELVGQNYCRNPGGTENKPWCFVGNSSYDKIIEYCNIPKCANEIWIYIFLSVGSCLILIIFHITLIFYKKYHSYRMTDIQNINTPNADKNIYGSSQINSFVEVQRLSTMLNNEQISPLAQHLDRSLLTKVPQYTLQQVEFLEELGEGAFGKVYKGQLIQNTGETKFIAIKALKEKATVKIQQDFKREIELICDLKHDNIMCIIGAVLNNELFCMLFEYMPNGDLHEFLIANSPNEKKSMCHSEILKIALQISEGMYYLSSHHYVHRDLAARNCLVGDDLTVKISDFGLSRDIYSCDYYRVQSKSLLPVRWMPSESILYGKFTTESDVWSFGVVLWEIYSFGMQPFYGYSNHEVINMIRSRQLLNCPDSCPSAVYALMTDCWQEQSVRRPSFSEISYRLRIWFEGQATPHFTSSTG